MSRATSAIAKISNALRSVNATDRVVYKRLLSRVGGDPLIGKPTTVTVLDTVLSPQPAVFAVNQEQVKNATSQASMSLGSYKIIASSESLTKDDLETSNLSFVLKNVAGELIEELFIKSYTPYILDGVVLAWNIFAVSKKRG